MLSSSRRMRSFSSGPSSSRASRATCSTSFSEILGSLMTVLHLLEVRVLERQALAPDAGEVHGRDHLVTRALEAHEEALAPARMAQLCAEPEREVVRRFGLGRGDGGPP